METDNASDQALGVAILRSVQRSKYWLIALPGLFAIAAFSGTFLLNERWVASGVVQVGTVGNISGGARQHIESLPRALERLRLRPFQDLMLRELGIPTDERNALATLFRRTLWSRQIPGTDLLEISIHAHSKAQAVEWVNAIIQRLKAIHGEDSEPHVRQLQTRFQRLRLDLEHASAERRKIMELIVARQTSATVAYGSDSTLAVVAMLQGMEISTLERTLAVLEEQLGPMYTRPTSLMFDIQTAEYPVYPDRGRTTLLGALIGLLIGLSIVLIHGLRATSGHFGWSRAAETIAASDRRDPV